MAAPSLQHTWPSVQTNTCVQHLSHCCCCCCPTGSSHISEAPVVPDNLLTTEDVEDQEAPDDMSMPTYTQQVKTETCNSSDVQGLGFRVLGFRVNRLVNS